MQIPIFIINLEKDIEKKNHIKNLCEEYSLKCNFINAIYGANLEDKFINLITDKKSSINSIGRELGAGEIGCALSHIHIYKKMIKEDIEVAVILEDDIIFNEALSQIINKIEQFPKNWEIILLGYYARAFDERISKHSFFNRKYLGNKRYLVRLIETAYGTHGYIINKKGAQKLLKIMKKIILPIDHYTGTDKYINMYAIYPRIVYLHDKYKLQSNVLTDRDDKLDNSNKRKLLSSHKPFFKNVLKLFLSNFYITFKRFKKLKEYN